MLEHFQTLFSSQAAKAWVAGLVVFVAPYVVEWLNTLTADRVIATFGHYGLQLSEGGAAVVVGIAGLLAVYFTSNKPVNE